MTVDLPAAAAFLASSGRVLDRRRFELLTGSGGADAVVAAVDGYRNADGGYGWGLEPDLRSGTSQPGGALHALEAFADLAPASTPRAAQVCDWLASVSLPDGGLPFALPVPDPAACAPFWAQADPTTSSLQITAVVAATAHRLAAVDRAVGEHPWLAGATAYCLGAIAALDASVNAMELAFAVQFLDAAGRSGAVSDEARTLLDGLRGLMPDDGLLHVAGGAEDEFMRPLDFAPFPGGPARELFAPAVVDAELDRLAAGQQPDGGWIVDFDSWSPAAALEWRGHRTVNAPALLRANGRR
ncbi:hypothetical protein [Blastococcus goldschmidtiae]|uniref:Uncharacterized protein n=1 Tax=Blastococcus goldschmidtiae TaxID=3075546 RepID=A0ABU2K2B4_9ACTN|nr:hypothetical protein [Blastococcus sp. DSM 46792]MDT0274440.1 hypothetical protein [Blastococcus sp. DSM 46792]